MTEFKTWVGSGPKCFQVLGLSPSLLQNPMLVAADKSSDIQSVFLIFASHHKDKKNIFIT